MLTMARRTQAPRPGHNIVQVEAGEPPTFLGHGVAIRGVLEIDGELVVSGRVVGRITARRLVIAADGTVEGDVIAGEVVIAGRLNGRVFAPTVAIEDGARLRGKVEMVRAGESRNSAAPSTAAATETKGALHAAAK